MLNFFFGSGPYPQRSPSRAFFLSFFQDVSTYRSGCRKRRKRRNAHPTLLLAFIQIPHSLFRTTGTHTHTHTHTHHLYPASKGPSAKSCIVLILELMLIPTHQSRPYLVISPRQVSQSREKKADKRGGLLIVSVQHWKAVRISRLRKAQSSSIELWEAWPRPFHARGPSRRC